VLLPAQLLQQLCVHCGCLARTAASSESTSVGTMDLVGGIVCLGVVCQRSSLISSSSSYSLGLQVQLPEVTCGAQHMCHVFEQTLFSLFNHLLCVLQYGGFSSPQAAAEATSSSATEQQQAPAAAGPASALGPMVAIPQGHGDLCDVPASLVFPLGIMKFRGTPVSVPGDVPGVLRYRYGDTFMIPRCVGEVLQLASRFVCLLIPVMCAAVPLR
jgi:hypothetical protein